MTSNAPRMPRICIDFDGVIHVYRKGWQDGSIYGDIVPGFFDWVETVRDRFELVIFSTRCTDDLIISDMKFWMLQQYVTWCTQTHHVLNLYPFLYTHEKIPAKIYIDDRAISFQGQWNDPRLSAEALDVFQSWTAK